eukprot:22231_1
MEHLIQLRQSIELLNDEEFPQFITAVLGKDKLTDIIFNHFLRKLTNVDTINALTTDLIPTIQQINDKITTIIQSRAKDDEISQNTPLKLQYQPSVILSHIASFLSFDENIKFEQCSRSIFMSVRSMCMYMHEIPKNQFEKCMKFSNESNGKMYHWYRFHFINNISIKSNECVYSNWGNLSSLFQQTKTLNLNCWSVDDIDQHPLINSKDFLQQLNMCSWSNVNTFKFINDDDAEGLICFDGTFLDGVMSAVNKNKNLQYFHLQWGISSYEGSVIFTNYDWVPQLKGIAINLDDEQNESVLLSNIYPSIGNNLLSFHKTVSEFTSDINGKFDKLNEICLPWSSNKSNIEILMKQNLSKLKRIHFNCNGLEVEDRNDHKIFMGLLLKKIIKYVDYINIDACGDKANHLDMLHNLSNMMQNIRKPHLKLSIYFMSCGEHEYNIDDIGAALLKLINMLHRNCNGFEFNCLHYQQTGANDSVQRLLEKIKNKFVVESKREEMKEEGVYWSSDFTVRSHKYCCDKVDDMWIMNCGNCW